MKPGLKARAYSGLRPGRSPVNGAQRHGNTIILTLNRRLD